MISVELGGSKLYFKTKKGVVLILGSSKLYFKTYQLQY